MRIRVHKFSELNNHQLLCKIPIKAKLQKASSLQLLKITPTFPAVLGKRKFICQNRRTLSLWFGERARGVWGNFVGSIELGPGLATTRPSLFLGEALHLLGDPAHGGAPLLLLGQHRHHGLGKQVRVLPVAYHFLENCREESLGLHNCSTDKHRQKSQTPQPLCMQISYAGLAF